MRSIYFIQILLGTVIAHPSYTLRRENIEDDACPESWGFDFLSFHGPGCPDYDPSFNTSGYMRTEQGWGSHFVPGCETQWAWFKFPCLQASVGPDVPESRAKTWCEATLKYTEMKGTFAPYPVKKEDAKWRLKMHKNGTTMEAQYGLDDGVTALRAFTYFPTDIEKQQIVDEITINGRVYNGTAPASRLDWSNVNEQPIQWTEPECGTATMRMRIDLELTSQLQNGTGVVVSKKAKYTEEAWSGALMGVSYNWESCIRK